MFSLFTPPPPHPGEYDATRYHLNFLRESTEEVKARKLRSQNELIQFVDERELEVSVEDVYPSDTGAAGNV